MVHDRLVRQPARHRLVVQVERSRAGGGAARRACQAPAAELRDAGAADRAHTSRCLQRSFQDTAAASFGPVPFTGPEATGKWLEFLDLYMKLQREVDRHIGHVLRTLRKPARRWQRTR